MTCTAHRPDREAERQRALQSAMVDHEPGAEMPAGLLTPPGPRQNASPDAGLRTYQGNLHANLHRALTAAYHTVDAALGDEAMAALAQALWRQAPPQRGDLGWFGVDLPELLQRIPDYAEWPWLPDVARLDWAVHRAQSASDVPSVPENLAHLSDHDPASLRMRFAPGSTCLVSDWPIEALWRAHQTPDEAERNQGLDQARQALAQRRRDTVLVHRPAWTVSVLRLTDAEQAAFTHALWQGETLGEALAARTQGLALDQWLAQALSQRWLCSVDLVPIATTTGLPPGMADGVRLPPSS